MGLTEPLGRKDIDYPIISNSLNARVVVVLSDVVKTMLWNSHSQEHLGPTHSKTRQEEPSLSQGALQAAPSFPDVGHSRHQREACHLRHQGEAADNIPRHAWKIEFLS